MPLLLLLLLLRAALAGAEWAVGVRRGASSTAAQSWPMHRIGSLVFPPRTPAGTLTPWARRRPRRAVPAAP
jgi:hypothetical protein